MTDPAADTVDAPSDEILIVDDQDPNRLLLSEMLRLDGYQTFAVASGPEALEYIARAEPALVLLDVSMPGMSGFEVCRSIRQTAATASLPVILVTALGHREHRLEGIAAGANDYLTKPIDRADLLLRVRNAMHLRRLHRQQAEHFSELRRLERLRDSLVHMLVHDLRSPLTSMMAYLDMTRTSLADRGDTELVADLDEVVSGTQHLARMINDVLDVSRMEENALPLHLSAVDFRAIAEQVVSRIGINPGRVSVIVEESPACRVLADPGLIHRVIRNLVDNAIKFSPQGGRVRLSVIAEAHETLLRVTDSGPGIPQEHHERIFRKFGTVDGARIPQLPSTGLGLTFCKMVVEAHQGTIGLESTPGSGSTFWIRLPSAP